MTDQPATAAECSRHAGEPEPCGHCAMDAADDTGQFHEDHECDMVDPEYAEAFREATAEATTTAACGAGGNYGVHQEPLACAHPKGHDGPHAWESLPTFVNGQPVPDPDSAWWIVTADGLRVGGPFDDHEDAEGFAATWNSAYPSPEHTEFVVEQITAEEATRSHPHGRLRPQPVRRGPMFGLPMTPEPAGGLTVRQINALLGIDIWRVRSFRANVAIDFDEFGNVLSVTLLNPDQNAPDGT